MTLPTYLDDIEHNRIPADEIKHRTRLARSAFKLALAEAAAVARDEGGVEIHALHIEQHFRFREALGIDKHEGDSDWMDDPPDLLKSTSAMRNGYDTLIVLTSHVVARAAAEAVRAEREAIVGLCDASARTHRAREEKHYATMGGTAIGRQQELAASLSASRIASSLESLAEALRSRPSPDVAPPDLAVMRRVVEAARAYIDTVDNIIASAADGMPTKVFEQQAREHRGALKLAVSALDGRAQEADHVR